MGKPRVALIVAVAAAALCVAENRPGQVRRATVQRLAPVARWESRGIGGGGALYSASMSPHDTDEIYIATDMSAVFHTAAFGTRWETLPFSELQGGIESQVRFTSDPQVLYAIHLADDARTPVQSTDGGLTWTALPGDPTSSEAYSLHADPTATDRVLLSSYSDLYFSSNGGASFSLVYSSSDYHVAGVVWDGSTILVGARDGLLVSTNGGTSFAPAAVTGIPSGEEMVSMAGAREGSSVRLFAVTLGAGDVWPLVTGGEMSNYQGIYRLDWGAGSWTEVTTGIPADVRPFFVAMAANDIDTAYVAGGDTGLYHPIVYKTSNGGGSWSSVLDTVGNGNIATGWSGSGGDSDWWYGEYALGFAVSPVDADRAIFTDLGFAHVTDDGGASWRQAYVAPADQNPAGSSTPKGGAYQGVGLEDTSVWWLHWADASTIMAAFTDIRGIRSTDGGLHWSAGTSLGLPHNSTYHVVEEPGGGTLYAATSTVHDLYQSTYLADGNIDGGDGAVIFSTDDGASWEELHGFDHPVVWLALDPSDAQTMYASVVHSASGDVYVTHDLDQGTSASWSRLASPPRTEGHPYNIHVLANGDLLASYSGRREGSAFTQSSGVFLSTDDGASWLDRSDPGMVRWTKDIVVDPSDATQDTWYACVYSHWGAPPNEVGGVYRTTTRGVSWQRISDLYRVESLTVHPDDPQLALVTTETQGLWSTSNLGAATPVFDQVAEYPFRQPLRVFFNPHDQGEVWVTSFGGGLRVSGDVIFFDGFESGTTDAWSGIVP